MPVYTCTNDDGDADRRRQERVGSRDQPHPRRDQPRAQQLSSTLFSTSCPSAGITPTGCPRIRCWSTVGVRSGHPADQTTHLATEIASAVSRIANVEPTGS